MLPPLAELSRLRGLPAGAGPLRVLDLGAGCGAASLGLLAFLAGSSPRPLQITAVDRDAAALELLAALMGELSAAVPGLPPVELSTVTHDLSRGMPAGGRYHLVLISGLLNELPPEAAAGLAQKLLQDGLAAGGYLLVVEPALRETSRALHQLRDLLLDEPRASLVGPCTHRRPCPALRDPGDWCHEARLFTSAPPELQQLSPLSGLRRRELRFSYLCMGAGETGQPASRPGAWRVVSELLVSKGKREVFLCGEAGRVRAVLLNRDRSEANEPFRDLRRGQLCWIEDAGLEGDLRLSASSRVEAVDAGGRAL